MAERPLLGKGWAFAVTSYRHVNFNLRLGSQPALGDCPHYSRATVGFWARVRIRITTSFNATIIMVFIWPGRAQPLDSSEGGSSGSLDSAEQAAAAAALVAAAEHPWTRVPYAQLALRANSHQLKRALRNGCAPSLRRDVWFHISGGAALAADPALNGYGALARGGYAALARRRAAAAASPAGSGGGDEPAGTGEAAGSIAGGSSSHGGNLCRDSLRSLISGDAWIAIREEACPRGLPKALSDALMALPGGPAALQRLLVAYAAFNPAPGALWRGCGAVAAFALVVMRDEERAFWTLAGLGNRLFSYYDGKAQLGCLVEVRVLSSLIRSKLPHLAGHITTELEVPLPELLSSWVARCFVGALGSLEATARLWDCLLYEGPKVLHRAGLALLHHCQPTVLSCSHPAALHFLIEGRAAQAHAAPGREGALVVAAFRRSSVGGMPHGVVDRLRGAAVEEMERQVEDRRRRLAEILGSPRG